MTMAGYGTSELRQKYITPAVTLCSSRGYGLVKRYRQIGYRQIGLLGILLYAAKQLINCDGFRHKRIAAYSIVL